MRLPRRFVCFILAVFMVQSLMLPSFAESVGDVSTDGYNAELQSGSASEEQDLDDSKEEASAGQTPEEQDEETGSGKSEEEASDEDKPADADQNTASEEGTSSDSKSDTELNEDEPESGEADSKEEIDENNTDGITAQEGNLDAIAESEEEEELTFELKGITLDYDFPEYQFSVDNHDYELNLVDAVTTIKFTISVGEVPDNFYCHPFYIDKDNPDADPVSLKTMYVKKVSKNKDVILILMGNANWAILGESKTISLQFGTQDKITSSTFTNKVSEYNFTFTKKPSLSALSLKAADTQLTFNEGTFNKLKDKTNYSAVVEPGVNEVVLSATAATAATTITIGNDTFTGVVTDYTISLENYFQLESDTYVIPIELDYNVEGKIPSSNQYALRISKKDYTPKILQQPEKSVTVKKTDTEFELAVDVETPERGELSYQWYQEKKGYDFYPIAGETSASYKPDISKAGTYAYMCTVTNTVDGVDYLADTGRIDLTVELTYVNPLTIRYQPGTCSEGKMGFEETVAKSEYYVGEAFERIFIALNRPETGTEYDCKWYYNSENTTDISSATLLDSAPYGVDWQSLGELYYRGFTIQNTFGEGTYYLFCVTRAVDKTNPDNYSEITSDTFKFTYKPVDLDILDGEGTSENPYKLKTTEELQYLQKWVNEDGRSFEGVYFQFENDITLPTGWQPIGCTKDGTTNIQNGKNLNAFSATLDGAGHTLTVPEGEMPLLGYVKGATVKNLNIYGKRIEGYGLVNNLHGVGLTGSAIVIDGVKLLSESSTLKSGLIGATFGLNHYAGCSQNFVATIRNCTIEKDVVIGYTGTESGIGSIAGRLQGTIENCVSYAVVNGKNYVGGLVGTRDNALGSCTIENSQFYGTVNASGDFVGGIMGGGYNIDDSAPNAAKPSILNCFANGRVSGRNCVGGIIGGDEYVAQTWANGASTITSNVFEGTLAGEKYVGSIIGYSHSLNVYDTISGNSFSETCGAENAIGFVKYLDTNYPNPTLFDGTVLINTENGVENCPEILVTSIRPAYAMTWKKGHNRTDDPLKRTSGGETENICYKLTAEGSYKTEYNEGEALDLTGIELTAYWKDGSTTQISLADVTISGYNKNEIGQQTVTLSYGSAVLRISVVVLPKSSKITVSVTIMGDSKHGSTSTPHGLKMGGLVTWASEPNMEADARETVWDVLQRVFADYNISFSASDNNQYDSVYISAVNGLAEFDNGKNSGWMYTVNGTHPNVGVSAKFLQPGDQIILHYTDDYTKEEGGMAPSEDTSAAAEVDELISQIGTVTYTTACKERIDVARKAYNALSDAEKQKVTKLSVLTMAEARYASLKKADDQAQARNVISLIYKIVTPVTEQSKASIDAARKAYDALTADQKALVTNLSRLTDAEAAYAQLTATDADKKKAQAVIDKIKKLGGITLDSEKDIEAARKAYDALTDLQKKLVDNYDVLTAAETKLAMLKAMGKVSNPYITTGDYMEALGTPSVGSIGGEWMVIGLARSDRNVPGVEDYYKKVQEYVAENIDPETGRLHKAKSTDNSRIIIALTAIGKDVTNVGGYNLLAGLSDLEFVKYQGNNGPIWALLALDSGNYPVPSGGTVTRRALIDEILRVQTSDGGWTVSGDKADSDMTGMALTALAPYYTKDLKVQEAIDKAIARLSEMQDEDGGYSTSYDGTTKIATSESISQVVTALSALGINADTDPRFVKNGNSVIDALLRYYVKGGGFKHIMDGELDGMATEQAYYALTAYYRFLSGKTNLYDMTDIIDMGGDPVEIPTEPTVPATTEPTEVETGFPWWILVICVVGGCGLGMVIAIVIIPKFGKFKKKD